MENYLNENIEPYNVFTNYDKLKNYYKGLSRKTIFFYVVIFCILYLYFDRTFYKAFIVFIIIYILHTLYNNKLNDNINHKKHQIYPKTKNLEKDEDLVDLTFSIQEFYDYNPQLFIEYLKAVDTFLDIYEYINYDLSTAGIKYNSLEQQKFIAVNSIKNIIINCPDNKFIYQKINDASEQLNIILNRYLEDVKEKNKNYIIKNGFNNQTKLINKLNDPFNTSYDNIIKDTIF